MRTRRAGTAVPMPFIYPFMELPRPVSPPLFRHSANNNSFGGAAATSHARERSESEARHAIVTEMRSHSRVKVSVCSLCQ